MSFFPHTNLGGTGTPLGMNGTPTGSGFSPTFGAGMHDEFPMAFQSPAVRDIQMGNSGEVTCPFPADLARVKRQSETSCCLSEHQQRSVLPCFSPAYACGVVDTLQGPSCLWRFVGARIKAYGLTQGRWSSFSRG
jgi:hypothetical protein